MLWLISPSRAEFYFVHVYSCTVGKMSIIQYGYRKWRTHARVFSQTLAHGNSKNEIRQRKRIRQEMREHGKK